MKIKCIIVVLICSLLSFSLTAPSIACPPPDCPDCYTWDPNTEECVPYGDCWGGCPECESCVSCYCECTSDCCEDEDCNPCYSCVSCTCEWDCSAGQTCCNGTCCDPGNCCNNEICCNSGDSCCTDSGAGDAYCCAGSKTCCDKACCDPSTEKCCDDIGGDNDGYCCNTGEECCEGECCDPDQTCCENSTKCCDDCCDDVCCSAAETCCNRECCNNYSGICCDGQECCDWTIGEVCCNGKCCDPDCCDSWDCEHCIDGTCEPCLEKASDYEELTECSGTIVADPDWTPVPNGCSSPFGNNPASGACGESSSFLDACNAHDTCYQTCGSSKISECDAQFSSDLAAVCAPFSGDCEDSCDYWADIYVGAVILWGQAAWEDDQVLACACCNCD